MTNHKPDNWILFMRMTAHIIYVIFVESRTQRDIYCLQKEALHAVLIIPSYRLLLDKLLINTITIILMSL